MSSGSTSIYDAPPIYDVLLAACSPPTTLARIAKTSRSAHAAVQDFMTQRWHRQLRRFCDPFAFRSMQARTGVIVSGSQALSFFRGDDFGRDEYGRLSDLDLYPVKGTEREIGLWLIAQGYSYLSQFESGILADKTFRMDFEDMEDYASARDITACFEFFKPANAEDILSPEERIKAGEYQLPSVNTTPGSPDDREVERWRNDCNNVRVRIIAPMHTPIASILKFDSTPVMNGIAWDRAFCLFPRSTFEDQNIYSTRSGNPNHPTTLHKWCDRGYKYMGLSYESEAANLQSELKGLRWLLDGHSWNIKLMTHGVNIPSPAECTADGPIDLGLNGFTAEFRRGQPEPQAQRERGDLCIPEDPIWVPPTTAWLSGRLSVNFVVRGGPNCLSTKLGTVEATKAALPKQSLAAALAGFPGRDGKLAMFKEAVMGSEIDQDELGRLEEEQWERCFGDERTP
ncbi:hypothetical protein BKA62DRAFT_771213 [Auriculariales sp. MPI-PUGE-AT-0066]|nr:hypothetical protein BKA62DRAFT_771213 [Auriculariales sp. MPI-PUGE-AT-0066]